MGRFFQSGAGTVGLLRDADGTPPTPGATFLAAFDEDANVALIADFLVNYGRYAIVAGVLKKDGLTVAVAADSQAKQDIDGLLGAAASAVSGNNTYLAIANPTNAQVAAQVRALTQQNNRIIARLVLLNRLKG